MIRIYKIVCTLGLLMFFINLNAQNDLLNSKKYWYNRWRLTNDFMVVGDCQGCSLPASERYCVPWAHKLRWADGMIMMGQYLGMLATEYKLLSSHGQSTLNTRKELYYALLAINRVDEAAEPYIQTQDASVSYCPSDPNGFFLRDDVPANFVQDHYDHFNQYKTSAPHIDYTGEYDYDTVLTDTAFISNTQSDYSSSIAAGIDNFDAEMSLDQAVSILVGLRLIKDCVDGSATYNGENNNSPAFVFQDGETLIREEAKAIALRIGNWLVTHNFKVQRPCKNDDDVHAGCCGGVVWEWAIAKVLAEITQNPTFVVLSDPQSDKYDIWKDAACVFHAWDPGTQSDSGSYYVGKFMVLELLTAGAEIYPLTALNQYDCVNSKTYLALNCDDPLPYKTEWMPLLHSINNNYTLNSNLWPQRYIDYLNSAPCTGPFLGTVNYGYPNDPEWNWSATSLLYRPEHRKYYWDQGAPYGEFNGIDYMLLYNLYRIRAEMDGYPVNAGYYDMTDVMWDLDFPLTISSQWGSHANPIQQDGFNTFTATNTIFTDGDVAYRAGYEIALLNDFSVELGADFHAYVDPFDCDRTIDNEYRNQEFHSELASMQQVVSHRPSENESGENINSSEQNLSFNKDLQIYPNPNTGDFTLSVQSAFYCSSSLCITDLTGKTLYTQFINLENGLTQIQISKPELPAGIYFIKVDGFDEPIKMIITK